MGTTKSPGDESFTSALIYALERLLEEQPDGRFTTVDIMGKIQECPTFPRDQDPKLSDRERHTLAGRVMLHPLKEDDSAHTSVQSSDLTSPAEGPSSDFLSRQTMTLHFDLKARPNPIHVEEFGLELNRIFADRTRTLGVNRVRWGGMQSMAARIVKNWKANYRARPY